MILLIHTFKILGIDSSHIKIDFLRALNKFKNFNFVCVCVCVCTLKKSLLNAIRSLINIIIKILISGINHI